MSNNNLRGPVEKLAINPWRNYRRLSLFNQS